MLPGASLSVQQHLQRSFACWCVSHLPPISSSTTRSTRGYCPQISLNHGEFVVRRPPRPPPTSLRQSVGHPAGGGLRDFQLKLLSCIAAAGRKDSGGPSHDMTDTADHGTIPRFEISSWIDCSSVAGLAWLISPNCALGVMQDVEADS